MFATKPKRKKQGVAYEYNHKKTDKSVVLLAELFLILHSSAMLEMACNNNI